jgi:hypothetical protein
LLEELTEHLHAHKWVDFHLEFVQQSRRQLEEFFGGVDIGEHESGACANKDTALGDLARTEDSLDLRPDLLLSSGDHVPTITGLTSGSAVQTRMDASPRRNGRPRTSNLRRTSAKVSSKVIYAGAD